MELSAFARAARPAALTRRAAPLALIAGMHAFRTGEPPAPCAEVSATFATENASVCSEFGGGDGKYLSCTPKVGKRFDAFASKAGCERGHWLALHGWAPDPDVFGAKAVETFPETSFVFSEPADQCGPFTKCAPLARKLRATLGKEPLPCLDIGRFVECRAAISAKASAVKSTTYRILPTLKACVEVRDGMQGFCEVD